MATFLYRLGRVSFGRRRYVVLLWAAVLAAIGFAAASAPAAPADSSSMPGTESQQAFDLIDKRFPGTDAEGANAQVVFVAPSGAKVTATDYRAAIERTVSELSGTAQVGSATDPFTSGGVSEDGSTAYTKVAYTVGSDELSDASTQGLRDAIDQAENTGLTVEARGTAVSGSVETGGVGEAAGVLVAALVLLITFGSLAAAGVPLLTAIVGVGVSIGGIMALSSALGLSSSTGSLASMLGLAVGIDYAVFVIARYREERAKGHDAKEAAGLAVGTAGSAVVFAGLTVIIALAGLLVAGVPTLTKMGLAAAGTVGVSVLVALTLVPAVLGFWPNAVLGRRERKGKKAPKESGRLGSAWARFVLRRPLPVLLLSVVGLGVLAVPALDLQLGMPGDESKATSTTERRAYDDLAKAFGPGFNGPLTVVVNAAKADDPKTAVSGISARLAGTDGVVSVSPAKFNEAGDTALLAVTPSTSPTSEETKDLVTTVRADRADITAGTSATFEVTGTTAANIDMAQKMSDALIPYLIVVVGLAVLLLTIVFRSILVPLKAALGFLLSVLASLGVVVAVFQWGWGTSLLGVDQTGPIMSMMPIFLVGIVFGLAMDYEVFLVSRIREAYIHGERPGQAVVTGFKGSSRVVVAAALIMASVFAGFITAGESMIKTIGFGLAIAVLFDAIVVRMAFVPAVLALLGKRAWWLPRWLGRVLPRVDVEGEALTARAAAPADGDADADGERVPAAI
ncbi:MMPL family transporter [Streptomyces brevispora]|uniref:MMPL family transporter n=1 Tax=Streptomyces brevispora TaxID=887462 RepID=UPI00371C4FB7